MLLAVVVGVSLLPGRCNGSEVRGMHPEKRSRYNPTSDFTCLDDSATIPFSLVNDDYCDCRDGSDEPGTAACANGRFYCPNSGHKPQELLSSRVNDGICDCCDGSDEYERDTPCPNTCQELGKKAAEEYQRMRELQEHGYQKRIEYAQQGVQKRQESDARLKEVEAELERVKEEVEELRKAKEEAEEPEKQAKEEHRRKWEELQEARKQARRKAEAKVGFDMLDSDSNGFVSVQEIQEWSELDDDEDGVVTKEEALEYLDSEESVNFEGFFQRVWDVISDKIQFQRPESESEGGADNLPTPTPEMETLDRDEDEDYDYDYDDDDDLTPAAPPSDEMPDFDNATKELIAAADKARDAFKSADNRKRDLEREVGDLKKYLAITFGHNEEFGPLYDQCYEFTDREYVYKMCPFNKASQRPKKGGRETSLGTWGSWNGPSDNPYSSMKLENGEKCWNGPSRSTVVTLKCGLTDELLSASEPNRCEYAMDFTTPAVCEHLKHTHEEL